MPEVNVYTPWWLREFRQRAEFTANQVDFVADRTPAGGMILDVCCGDGRHALELARRGFRVAGVDVAADVLPRDAVGVEFHRMDMRRVGRLGRTFDVVACLWQSFGFLEATENHRAFEAMAGCVAPGGALILDVYHPPFWPEECSRPLTGASGTAYVATYHRRDGRLTVAIGTIDGDEVARYDWQLFHPDELARMGEGLALDVETVCTTFDDAAAPTDDDLAYQIVFRRRRDAGTATSTSM